MAYLPHLPRVHAWSLFYQYLWAEATANYRQGCYLLVRIPKNPTVEGAN